MDRESNYIGTHLVMDITSYDASLLRDEGKVSEYLYKLIELADMTCLIPPQVFRFPFDGEYKKFLERLRAEGTMSPLIEERLGILDYNKTEGSGITGITVLAESHAAIHTFPEKKDPFMSVCLYSCKSYDEEKIVEYTNKYWDVKDNYFVIMHRYVGEPQRITSQRINRPKLTLV